MFVEFEKFAEFVKFEMFVEFEWTIEYRSSGYIVFPEVLSTINFKLTNFFRFAYFKHFQYLCSGKLNDSRY